MIRVEPAVSWEGSLAEGSDLNRLSFEFQHDKSSTVVAELPFRENLADENRTSVLRTCAEREEKRERRCATRAACLIKPGSR